MADPEIKSLNKDLKKDLEIISTLSYDARSRHLLETSKPLLSTLFQLITHLSDDLAEDDVSKVCDYLVEYLNYGETVAIEILIILYKLKDMKINIDAILDEKIETLIDLCDTKSDRYKVFSILTQLFPFDAVLCSQIYAKKSSFLSLMTNEVTLAINNMVSMNTEYAKNLNTLLKLMSNSCLEETSRSITASMHINLLIKCLSLPSNEITLQSKCYAATTTIKLWRMIKPETLENHQELLSLNHLLSVLLEGVKKRLDSSIEGLTLLSINVQVKKKVRNKTLLDHLILWINNGSHTKFGVLSILTLLITPNRILKVQQRSISAMKDSNSIQNIDINTNKQVKSIEDDPNEIQAFIKLLVKEKIFSTCIKETIKSLESSKGLIGQSLRLIYNAVFPDIDLTSVSKDDGEKDGDYRKVYIAEMKQIVHLLTAYLIGNSQNIKYNQEQFITFSDSSEPSEGDLELRLTAIKALSSPNISGNVELIYDNGTNDMEFALSPVPFLLELLVQHDIDTGVSLGRKKTPFSSIKNQIVSSFDVYYGFVALAALASLQHQHVKTSIFNLGFDSIFNAINSNDDKLQFASLQLLNEIVDLPLCIAKLFNWNKETDDYYQNFLILAHLIQSNSYDSQCLVLQIFYSVSRYGVVAEKLCQSELFCAKLAKTIKSQSSDETLIYYAFLILSNLFQLKGQVEGDHLDIFDSLARDISLYRDSDDSQIREIASCLLEKMQ